MAAKVPFFNDLLVPLFQGLLLIDSIESEALRADHVDGVVLAFTDTSAVQVLGSVDDVWEKGHFQLPVSLGHRRGEAFSGGASLQDFVVVGGEGAFRAGLNAQLAGDMV